MSHEFAVGQRVVCVDDHHAKALCKGVVYTIEAIRSDCRFAYIDVAELSGDHKGGWFLYRFKPLESKSIELFRVLPKA